MNFKFQKIVPDVLCVVLFAVIAFMYFSPAVLEGRRLDGHDHSANDGISMEINQYRDTHDGETPRWVTSVFGGMPTYQIAPSYSSTKTLSIFESVYHLGFPDYIWYVFASMLGFYILLRAFDFKQWMAALGAIVWAFSSYFFIIIAAGHIWKVITLTYIPPTIAGLVLCYRSMDVEDKKERNLKLFGGFLLTAFFGALQILSNHVQMTYYFLFPIFFMVIAYLVMAIQKKQVKQWCIATCALAVAAVMAVSMNLSNLYNTYEYQKESMRGKSELVKHGNTEDQTDSGLERSYITAWSYGIDETFTFLIPNYRGGASVPLSMNGDAMELADEQFRSAGIYGAFTQYWGEQPGTSGPVYLGAIVCLLFVLSLIMIPNKNPMKWALLATTMLTLMLGWGKNFMPFTNFFIDYFPMYAKFRTVSSILVVVEFTVPLMAMWGLKLFVEKPNMKALYTAFGITVGITLILMFMGGDCISSMDRRSIDQYVAAGYFDQMMGQSILSSVSKMRASMLTSDGWRTIFFVTIGALLLFAYGRSAAKKEGEFSWTKETTGLCVLLLALCLIDMWQVNKRYLNDDMFQAPALAGESIKKGDCENYILAKSGAGRDYRVMNMAVSTFNDNTTSAFFSSIGGYHAAKLRRYQEVIEAHISPEMQKVIATLQKAPMDTVAMAAQQSPYPIYNLEAINTDSIFPVINMLNTRWFIVGVGEGRKLPIENTTAMGNAWFVSNVEYVDNANQELEALGNVNLRNTAVVAKKDFGFLKAQGEGTVELTAYGADEAKYTVESKQGGLVVFSETYYPGWTATIDGQETEVGRANYILRAINVPAGKHEVVFTFRPKTVKATEGIATAFIWILIACAAIYSFLKNKKEK